MQTLYLTKVPVHSLLNRQVSNGNKTWDINSPRFRHRAVMGLFGELGQSPRQSNSILFRLDRVPGQTPFFLVQSDIQPTNIADVDGVETRELGQVPGAGQTVVFRIAVNAIRRKTIEEAGRKKTRTSSVPYDHDEGARARGETALTPWLENKLAGALTQMQVTNHVRDVLRESKKGMALQVDTIDGVGVVDDPETLAHLIHAGVGREKSYGCGLLSVRPV
ncbi:type I-E CRISPR-associated protein Cas6/Cse3/CasE [Corynebacterium yudongzhengii]|nr:type I-E CRISPR-associated protein Cas6/Cse3/CasE [Corynebacterium yudongzhengii]